MNNSKTPRRALSCAVGMLTMLLAPATYAVVNAAEEGASALAASAAKPRKPSKRLIVRYRESATQSPTESATQSATESATQSATEADTLGLRAESQQALVAAGARAQRVARHVRKMASGAHVIEFDRSLDEDATSKLITDLMRSDASIEHVEADLFFEPAAKANDAQFERQWYFKNDELGISLAKAWNSSTGSGVYVAVLDTGFLLQHEDLKGRFVAGYDFVSDDFVARDGEDGRDADPSDPGDWNKAGACEDYTGKKGANNSGWHGSHVAGLLGARTNNKLGISGVAYDAKIVPVRIMGRCGGFLSDWLDGLSWAAGLSVAGVPKNKTPVKVANLSFFDEIPCTVEAQRTLDMVRGLGVSVVTSAGNGNVDASQVLPGGCNNVINVAATGRTGARAWYSNFGSRVTLAAPGGDYQAWLANGGREGMIISTVDRGTKKPEGDDYFFKDGTSMAAPQVAGVIALLLAKRPSLTPDQIKSLLVASAKPIPLGCPEGCGAGLLNAAGALALLEAGGAESTNPVAAFGIDVQGRLYHQRGGLTAAWNLLCLDGDCRPGTLRDGRFERTVSVAPGSTYHIEFKAEEKSRSECLSGIPRVHCSANGVNAPSVCVG